MESVVKWVKRPGYWPYLVVMMLLPGGTLFALALLLYRRSRFRMATPAGAALAVARPGRHVAPIGSRGR